MDRAIPIEVRARFDEKRKDMDSDVAKWEGLLKVAGCIVWTSDRHYRQAEDAEHAAERELVRIFRIMGTRASDEVLP